MSVQGPVASDLAALEAIWGMYLRNNITHPVCLGGAAPKLACLCCLQIVLCALHGEMKKLEGKVFSSVSKAPRNFHQTEVESLVWLVLKPTRSYWHRSESKDQRHCYVSVDSAFYGAKLVVFKNSHPAFMSCMCKVTALLPLLTIRPFVYLATCIFSCE